MQTQNLGKESNDALLGAIITGDLSALNALLDTGTINLNQATIAKCEGKLKNELVTALNAAIFLNQEEMLKRLVVAGADVNLKDVNGFTPLMNAAISTLTII